MGFDNDLQAGFAQLIATDIDPTLQVAWRPTGNYQTTETGIYIRHVPALPNRVIVLSSYGLSDDPVYADSDVGLQVHSRGAGEDPRDGETLDGAVADVLLGRFPLTLSTGVRVVTLVRSSSAPLGQDDNRRWSYVSNYTLGLHRPALHRL